MLGKPELAIIDKGKGNAVLGAPTRAVGVQVTFEGDNNAVSFGTNVRLTDFEIIIRGKDCKVRIDSDCRFTGRIRASGDTTEVTIGERTTAERLGIVAAEGRCVRIGARCMISYGVEIRNTDAHSILDLVTGERINHAADVAIGDHVWLGAHSLICKGVTIPNDCIVGQGSIVTKSIPEPNCVAAGNPARVVRTGTTWDNKLLP